VLVLNQSYEPISICNVQKAIVLLVLTKAELVAGLENRAVRSVRESFAFPSVIRLRRYIHAPIKKIELSRKNILRRDGNRCQYCGTTRAPLTVDHVMPRSRGGGDSWENLVCACVKCNIRKGNRTPDEAGMKLAKTPRRPTHVTFIRNINGDVDEHWKPYLFI
jgi:5-methylcytosine-specific restriction endonuclease McrA